MSHIRRVDRKNNHRGLRRGCGIERLERRRLLSVSLVQPVASTGLRPYGDGVDLNGKLLIPAQSLGAPRAALTGSPPKTTGDDWWKMLAPVYGSGTYNGGGSSSSGGVVIIGTRGGAGFAGTGLYLTDGTVAGTVRVFDGNAYNVRVSGGRGFFETSPGNIYFTDGTAAGTAMLVPSTARNAGRGGRLYAGEPNPVVADPYWGTANGVVFWEGADGVYAIDPGHAAAVKLASADHAQFFTAVGSSAYFVDHVTAVAATPGGYTSDDTWMPPTAATPASDTLYQTDGTAAGTQSVTDLPAGVTSLVSAGGKLYATVDESGNGVGIYRLDGTSTVVHVADVSGKYVGASGVGATLYVATSAGLFALDPSTGVATGLFGGAVESLPTANGPDGSARFVVGPGDSPGEGVWTQLQLWATNGTLGGTRRVESALNLSADAMSVNQLQMSGAWTAGGTTFVAASGIDDSVALWTIDTGSPNDSAMASAGGMLLIRGHDTGGGGSGVDQVKIRPLPGALSVTINAETQVVPTAGITGLGIFTLGGDDTVDLRTVPLPATIAGGDGNDSLTGGAAADSIDGGRGSDTLSGGGGDDFLRGGPGNDVLYGRAGNDTLVGMGGDDSLVGGPGDDALMGFSDDPNRTLPAGAVDNDTLVGNDGNDFLNGGPDGDVLFGGDQLSYGGTDTSVGHDTLEGGAGDDQLYGGVGASTLLGEDGDDSLWSAERGDEADALIGGPGTDAVIADAGDHVYSAEIFPH